MENIFSTYVFEISAVFFCFFSFSFRANLKKYCLAFMDHKIRIRMQCKFIRLSSPVIDLLLFYKKKKLVLGLPGLCCCHNGCN